MFLATSLFFLCKNREVVIIAKRLKYEDVKYFIEVESDSGCKLINEEYLGNR